MSPPCLKAGDSLILSWGAFGSLLCFIALVSAINGGDKRETRVQYSSERGLPARGDLHRGRGSKDIEPAIKV
ncbi:MAG: hypothetical protein FWG81_11120 [Betaproteobacteria bacterium]|nr:hypothetical protein [Betaproteobacteria bacterium]